jgi:type IV pilus assembly protein PilA
VKKFLKHFRYGQKGFTLIELLVVIGILGAIAAIVVPNVGKFIGSGKEESYATELHNIETSVTAMLVEDADSTLDSAPITELTATNDMRLITGTSIGGTAGDLVLMHYITGLSADDPLTPLEETEDPPPFVKTGCKYWFDLTGTVHQVTP